MEEKQNEQKNYDGENQPKITEKIIETQSVHEIDQNIQNGLNEFTEKTTQMLPPLMKNPSKIQKQEAESKDQDLKNNNGEILKIINAYQIPQVLEFDILKNSQGEYQVEDHQNQEIITPITMPDNNFKLQTEKKQVITNKANSPNNQGTNNQKQQQNYLVKKLFQKQGSQSIVLEHCLNTQIPSNFSDKSKDQQKQPPLPKSRREVKQRNSFLTLSTRSDFFGLLSKKSNQEIKAFSETENYHENVFCCDILYKDDCCLKQVLDLFFQVVFAPFRLFIFILRICIACFEEEDEEQEQEENNQNSINQENPCFSCCYNIIYCPFKCCGDWFNQVTYSLKQFICKGLWILPEQVADFYNSSIQNCLIQTGLFLKSCCFFTSNFKCIESLNDCCCLKPFHLFGECLMWICSPNGICQHLFKALNFITCKLVSTTCISKLFCFCYSKVQKPLKNNKEVSISYCCGCPFEVVGDIQDIEQNL